MFSKAELAFDATDDAVDAISFAIENAISFKCGADWLEVQTKAGAI